MDGVIIDSEPIHMACEREIFKMLGISVSNQEHHSMIGTTDTVMWTRFKGLFGLSQSIEELVRLKHSLYCEYLKTNEDLRPIPYIPELIKTLYKEGYILALASSSPHAQIDYILSEFNLKGYFNVIVSGDDVKFGKPNPEIFLKASGLVDFPPENCVVIEDSNNGVLAAKSANMKCIGYGNSNSCFQSLQDINILVLSFKGLTVSRISKLLLS